MTDFLRANRISNNILKSYGMENLQKELVKSFNRIKNNIDRLVSFKRYDDQFQNARITYL